MSISALSFFVTTGTVEENFNHIQGSGGPEHKTNRTQRQEESTQLCECRFDVMSRQFQKWRPREMWGTVFYVCAWWNMGRRGYASTAINWREEHGRPACSDSSQGLCVFLPFLWTQDMTPVTWGFLKREGREVRDTILLLLFSQMTRCHIWGSVSWTLPTVWFNWVMALTLDTAQVSHQRHGWVAYPPAYLDVSLQTPVHSCLH